MNAPMRSLRDSTSDEGLKSIIWTLRHPAVAGKELSLGLEQPGELHLIDVRERSLEHPRTLATRDLRRDRQEELVGQAALAEPAVEGGTALAEDRLDAALLQQPFERFVEVDPVRVPDQRHRRGGLRRFLVGGREDHHPAPA